MQAYFASTKVTKVNLAEAMREIVHAMCDEASLQLMIHHLAAIGARDRLVHSEEGNIWEQKKHERNRR
jgi:hypothetical protein